MKKKKILKRMIIMLPILFVLGIMFIVGSSYFEHRALVEQEKEDYPAPGMLVDVNDNGDKLHVYSEGEGEVTFVFMSGFGTPSPVYDFQVLYQELSEDYEIAVVERAGYGWSDVTKSPRDVDTVLEETRKALQMAGKEGPYVLVPHSLSGIEAIHWANLYPEEIISIIGLDPLVPEYKEVSEEGPTPSRLISFLANTGLMRNQPKVFEDNLHAMKKGHLNGEAASAAESLFFRRVQTENMWQEAKLVGDNAKTVMENGIPNVPFYAFISKENDSENWIESITVYTNATEGEAYILEGEHYIHLDFPEFIAEKSRELVEESLD